MIEDIQIGKNPNFCHFKFSNTRWKSFNEFSLEVSIVLFQYKNIIFKFAESLRNRGKYCKHFFWVCPPYFENILVTTTRLFHQGRNWKKEENWVSIIIMLSLRTPIATKLIGSELKPSLSMKILSINDFTINFLKTVAFIAGKKNPAVQKNFIHFSIEIKL